MFMAVVTTIENSIARPLGT